MVIEILGTRVLAPFYGSTIFVWTSLITITLGTLALGYFVGGYFADSYPKRNLFYGTVFIAGLLAVLLINISQPILVFSDTFGFRWGPLVAGIILFSPILFFFGVLTPFAIRLQFRGAEPGDYFAFLQGFPIREIKSGQASVGVAAASKLYFTVSPANIFLGIYYKTASLIQRTSPWGYIILGLLVLIILFAVLRRFISLNISFRKKE